MGDTAANFSFKLSKMVSVVTAFRNEKDQIKKTGISLYKSLLESGDKISEFIIVNDNSDDEYDYQSDINYLRNIFRDTIVKYYNLPQRVGAAQAKAFGVSRVKSSDVLLIDAHMRFIDPTWVKSIEKFLENHPRTINCLNTIGFDPDTEEVKNKIHSSAYLDINPDRIFITKWSKKISNDPYYPISLVLGASYFFRKDYWDYLHGLEGLTLWGKEEEYLSIKSWGLGNGCYIMNNCKIAHLYRKTPPTNITKSEVWRNILFINEVLDLKTKDEVKNLMKNHKYFYLLPGVKSSLQLDTSIIENLKNIYKSLGFNQNKFWDINDYYIQLNNS